MNSEEINKAKSEIAKEHGMGVQQIAIYGAGGFGREVAWLVQSCNRPERRYEVVCFIDDNEDIRSSVLNGISVMGLSDARRIFPDAKIVSGNGIPRIREFMVKKAIQAGFCIETVIHPDVERSQWIDIGTGVIICAGNILTTNIILDDHVLINLDCTVGHDVRIGEYCTLSPGVHISGFVYMGKRIFVGTGAVIINGTQGAPIIIGDDVTIGAGACVVSSIQPGQTVQGVPARSR